MKVVKVILSSEKKVRQSRKPMIEQLEKAAAALKAKISRGYRKPGTSTYRVIDRYEELREKSTQEDWTEYCKKNGFAISHDAYDFFA